ncbi:TIGR03086 family metal-binding protein [Amycolatopsis sp. GM8]|uniref:TIGR03086 family metal-binding protein n=1 Tax=Amycolatopsis sp. GM8 TaxID=2896530 RepID=UPI001F3D4F48|nr:TIGR03086 family metal-binding protein [Amycolatopsis sp. GM8]
MTFTKTVVLPVGLDEAFALVTQPERLRRWQTVSARVDLRVGGAYHWTVTPGHRASGTFKEIEPGKRVVFGWGWEGDELAPDMSTVTITLEPVGESTRITLVHEGLTAAQAASHAEGWNHYFDRLQRYVATGDAGTDEWAWAPDPIDPLIAAEASLAALQPILRGLRDEDRTRPTPCDDYDCHALAEHLFGSLTTLGDMAGATVTRPDGGSLEACVSEMTGEVIKAWLAHRGDTIVGGDLPADTAKTILSLELLLHGWDFARASGKTMKVSDELVAYVSQRGLPTIDGSRERGVFRAAVDAPAEAGALDRLAAYSGRSLS